MLNRSTDGFYSLLVVLSSAALLAGFFITVRLSPFYHDEFSYILQADTMCAGRLKNPPFTHPDFFEAAHVLVEPYYQFKYQPLHGALLCVSDLVFRSKIAIVPLLYLLASFLSYLWFRIFLPPRESFLASLLINLNPFLLARTGYSYWGATENLVAGYLLWWASARVFWLRQSPTVLTGIFIGLACMTLGLTRPFEGVLCAIPPFLGLAWYFLRSPWEKRRTLLAKVGIPVLICFVAFLAIQLTVNFYQTGDVFRLAYMEYHQQYIHQPMFHMVSPPEFSEAPKIASRYLQEMILVSWPLHFPSASTFAEYLSSLGGYLSHSSRNICLIFLVPFIFLAPFSKRKTTTWFVFPVFAAYFFIQSLCIYYLIHYSVAFLPVYGLVLYLGVEKMWELLNVVYRIPKGVAFGILAAPIIAIYTAWYTSQLNFRESFYPEKYNELVVELEEKNESSLVFVYHEPLSLEAPDFVYNGPDVPNQKVIFARYFNPEKNKILFSEFPNREAWVLGLVGGDWSYSRYDDWKHEIPLNKETGE